MSRLLKWLWVIVCQWLLSLGILVILAFSLWNCGDYWRTANWKTTEGKITSLKITGAEAGKPSVQSLDQGKLICHYAYGFGGRNYSGNRIGVETFDDASRRTRRYRELKTRLDEGRSITVWVNPAAPNESALFRETLSEMYFGPALGLIWFGTLYFGWKRRSQKRDSAPRD